MRRSVAKVQENADAVVRIAVETEEPAAMPMVTPIRPIVAAAVIRPPVRIVVLRPWAIVMPIVVTMPAMAMAVKMAVVMFVAVYELVAFGRGRLRRHRAHAEADRQQTRNKQGANALESHDAPPIPMTNAQATLRLKRMIVRQS